MGKGGGILMVGIGVALLSLAYTGRAQEVWAALTKGDTAAAPDASSGSTVQPESSATTRGTRTAGESLEHSNMRYLYGGVA